MQTAKDADSDAALVERVKNGDMSAFDTLTLKYRERLFGVVYNMLGNREDAMDIVQDAFIKAFSSIGSFRGSCAFYVAVPHCRKYGHNFFKALPHAPIFQL